MFSYSREILVEIGWIFQRMKDIKWRHWKSKTYNAPCLWISLQLYSSSLFPKMRMWGSDREWGHKVGDKESWIYRSLSGGHWLVAWWHRERALTTLPGRPSHAFSGMPLSVNIILLNICVTSSCTRKLQLCVYFGVRQCESQSTVQPDLCTSPISAASCHHH